MAKIIILEGLSRTGKSSIAENLQSKFGFRSISIKNKMPEFIQNYQEFYHGIQVLANEMFKAFPEETFILDRSFISELVYSEFFERETLINKDDSINNLLSNNFVLINFSNSYEKYIERGPKDRIIYTEQDFLKQKNLFNFHCNDIEFNRKLNIDTTKYSIEESEKMIIEHLKALDYFKSDKEIERERENFLFPFYESANC